MHFKHRIGATLVGLGLLTVPVVVPAFAQQQVTPAAASQDTSTTSEAAQAQRELSVSEAEIQRRINEDFKAAPLTQEDLSEFKVKTPKNNQERALDAARKEIGYKEQPLGSNCNKFSRYFGKGCQPWCADFVSWAFDSTGNKNKRLPWSNPSAVSSILAWGKKEKHLVKTPKPGDIFIYKNNQHTGLVWKVSKDGKRFLSIEGNSSNMVRSGWRTINSNYQFVRVPEAPGL